MEQKLHYQQARTLLLQQVAPLETEIVPLEQCGGRVLAEDIAAEEDIPPFDRSPYDGYAFRASDTAGASPERPVTLRVLEEIPAGNVPRFPVMLGTASRLMTGAPIPVGADAVVMYEKTQFTQDTVTIFQSFAPGTNIVRAGEDIRVGTVLAHRGARIDPGLAGTLASLGIVRPTVYRVPKIGILSTGNELAEAEQTPEPGRIRNSNRYALAAALNREGWEAVYLGTAGDDTAAIAALLERGLAECDAVLSTGGVSVGDFDLTPIAMEQAGAHLLFQRTDINPEWPALTGCGRGSWCAPCQETRPPLSRTSTYWPCRP